MMKDVALILQQDEADEATTGGLLGHLILREGPDGHSFVVLVRSNGGAHFEHSKECPKCLNQRTNARSTKFTDVL